MKEWQAHRCDVFVVSHPMDNVLVFIVIGHDVFFYYCIRSFMMLNNDVDIISAHSYHVQKLLLTFFCCQLLHGFTFFDNIINNLIANVDFRIDEAHTQSINFYMLLWQTNLAEFFDLHWSTWKCSVKGCWLLLPLTTTTTPTTFKTFHVYIVFVFPNVTINIHSQQ